MDYVRDIAIDTQTVKIRELTVRDIRALLKPNETGEVDVIAESLMDDVSFEVITYMTNLELKDLEEMKPSQFQQVVEGCKEVNQSFFTMVRKWLDVNATGNAT